MELNEASYLFSQSIMAGVRDLPLRLVHALCSIHRYVVPAAFFREERNYMASGNALINRAQCKKFALRWAQENRRGWTPNRVSKQFLDDLDTKVRLVIQSAISHHPSVGQTIKDLI